MRARITTLIQNTLIVLGQVGLIAGGLSYYMTLAQSTDSGADFWLVVALGTIFVLSYGFLAYTYGRLAESMDSLSENVKSIEQSVASISESFNDSE